MHKPASKTLAIALFTTTILFTGGAVAAHKPHWIALSKYLNNANGIYVDTANILNADDIKSATFMDKVNPYPSYFLVMANCRNGAVNYSDLSKKSGQATDLFTWNVNDNGWPNAPEVVIVNGVVAQMYLCMYAP